MKVYVVGIGMGNVDTLTVGAKRAIESSGLLIGAKRLLESFDYVESEKLDLIKPSDIIDALANATCDQASILMSGDVGFYSGATALYDKLGEYDVEVIPGISSLVYFCAKLRTTWQDATLVSAHGREHDAVGAIQSNAKTFCITGGKTKVDDICRSLVERGLGDVQVAAGERLSYDDERILGADDWAMTGNTHDAITLGFNGKMNSLHVMLTYNQNDENMDFGGTYYAGAFPCKTMQNAWYHFEAPWFPLGLSLLYMNIGMQAGIAGVNEHVEWQQVAGGYLNFHHEIVSFEGAYYKQSGKSEKGIKIDAWMASAKAKLKPSKYYGFEAGYDFLSGDDYMAVPSAGMIGLPQHKVIKGFSSIFGSHHKFYGAMDFFYLSTYVNGFTPGLQNAYIGAYTTPIKGLRVDLSYHYLATSLELKDMEKTLGHELEASVSYAILEDLSLSVGMSYMTGTRTMELLKRASDDHNLRWLWVSLNANPRIFSKIW